MSTVKITSIRHGPGGRAAWLVTIEGVCTDAPFWERKLRSNYRFRNVIKHRFGIEFDPMPQADWLAMIEAAMAKDSNTMKGSETS